MMIVNNDIMLRSSNTHMVKYQNITFAAAGTIIKTLEFIKSAAALDASSHGCVLLRNWKLAPYRQE